MTERKKRVPPRDRDGEGVPEPKAKAEAMVFLGHRRPELVTKLYRHVGIPDRKPDVRSIEGQGGATIAFAVSGRPYRAMLPDVSLREARVRAGEAYRLIRAARDRERQAEAVLRGDPASTART